MTDEPDEPKVSIIVPTYNRCRLITNVIKKIQDQKYKNFEIIVVDDNSKDDTEKYVKNINDMRIRYVKHDVNLGAPKAKTTGIQHAKYDYILFGEDDVLLDENYLKTLMNCMKKNNADIIAGRIIYMGINETQYNAKTRMNNVKKPLINMDVLEGNFGVNEKHDIEVPFVHALFLTKKNIFDIVSYDENYRGNGYREETDPQISALKNGFKIMFCPHAICYHLPRINNPNGGQWKMSPIVYEYWAIKNNIYFLKKHYIFLKHKYNLKHNICWMIIRFTLHRMIQYIKSKLYYVIVYKVNFQQIIAKNKQKLRKRSQT